MAPLAELIRPRTIDDVVGQDHLVGPDGPLRKMAQSGQLRSMIFWGQAGTGKTTLARILSETAGFAVETISAVSSGVKDLRDVIARAQSRLGERGVRTVLFIDEVHRFNKSQQDLLLPVTESGEIVLIGATTENPYFEVNAALISRTTQWRVLPLTDEAIRTLLERGATARGGSVEPEAIEALVGTADGDGRSALTTLDVAFALVGTREPRVVTVADVAAARDGRVHHQSADSHYDQISAFIKSVRGSDPDAALLWLNALLDAGESPRFIARRLVILASEDIGLADPMGLVLAESAARAVEFVGLPEGRLTLAHATIALSLMEKSNSVTIALGRASEALRNGTTLNVPAPVRDAHYASASVLGHGVGYQYPHDYPSGWVAQQYLPDDASGLPYYEPTDHGREAVMAQVWRERRAVSPQRNEGSPVE